MTSRRVATPRPCSCSCSARLLHASDFRLDETTAPYVARLCQRLDGLPLAIELAGARAATLSVVDIVDRLERSLAILGGAHRTAAPRQRTLQAAIAWSYDLLSTDERTLFDRLTVCSGGFALDMAEALAPPDVDALDVLGALVNRSMVQLELQSDGAARYRLLEPLRQFGREQIAPRQELEAVCGLHARAMVALAERAEDGLVGPDQPVWFVRLDRDWANLRAALDWAQAHGEVETALRLIAPLWLCWTRPDRQAEGRRRLSHVLALDGSEAYPHAYAWVSGTLAMLTFFQGDPRGAAPLVDRALAAARALADGRLEVFMLRVRGLVLLFRGESVDAEGVLLYALDRARAADFALAEASILADLASVAVVRGKLDIAEDYLRTGLLLSHAGRLDPWSEAMSVNSLGDVLRARGDATGAAEAYARALPALQRLNGGEPPPGMLHNLGYVALARGDAREAIRLFLDSADRYRAIGGDRRGLAECVIGLGVAALGVRQPDVAARLFGAAQVALDGLGTSMTPTNQADYDRAHAELAARLTPEQLSRGLGAGRGLTLEGALDLARDLAPAPSGAPSEHGLTNRELEIAGLLVRGYRNRDIASALVITEKTAANHVQRILDKLGVRSRAQVAARAAELGLPPTPPGVTPSPATAHQRR